MNKVACAVALAFLVLAGCGRPEARVFVTLEENGRSLEPQVGEDVSITLVSADPSAPGTLATGEYEAAEGRFKLNGPHGDTVPSGDYKVAIRWTINEGSRERERFRGAFAEDKTPLHCSVSSQSVQELVIDVTARAVKQK